MKIKILFGIIVFFIVGIFIYWYGLKTDYHFDTSFYQKGEFVTIKKTEDFIKSIKKIELEKNILSQDEYSVKMRLTRHDLSKIINSDKLKIFIDSYEKEKEKNSRKNPGLTCGMPECM